MDNTLNAKKIIFDTSDESNSRSDIISHESNINCNVSFEELDEDEINKIQKRMYPGEYSKSGFLQLGETLFDVYNNDKIFLTKVNITYEQIYDKWCTIIGKYYTVLELRKKCLIEGKFAISSICYNRSQRCPFQNKEKDNRYHGYEYGNQDITIVNILNNQKITINTLLLHMIYKHHFCESPLSFHRLDPAKSIEFFDLKSNIDYTPEYKTYNCWEDIGSYDNQLNTNNIGLIINIGLKTYKLNENVVGILLPFEFEFSYDFFINILIQDFNFSWKELLEEYKLSERKVNYILKSIEEYKNKGDLTKMYLYIFNVSDDNKQNYKFNIEGADIRYNSSNKICYYKYITKQYVPLDEHDVLS